MHILPEGFLRSPEPALPGTHGQVECWRSQEKPSSSEWQVEVYISPCPTSLLGLSDPWVTSRTKPQMPRGLPCSLSCLLSLHPYQCLLGSPSQMNHFPLDPCLWVCSWGAPIKEDCKYTELEAAQNQKHNMKTLSCLRIYLNCLPVAF